MQLLVSQTTSHENLCHAVLHRMASRWCPCVHVRRCGSGLVPRPCTQLPTSLGGCVQGVGTRVARVGGRCAVVWLASEWHRVVCAVCVLHMVLKVAPSSCIRSQSPNALLRFCCCGIHPLSPFFPLPPTPLPTQMSIFW